MQASTPSTPSPFVCRECGSLDVSRTGWVDINSQELTNDSAPTGEIRCWSCDDEVEVIRQSEFLTHQFDPRSRSSLEALDPAIRGDLVALGVGKDDVEELLEAAVARRATLLIGPSGCRFISIAKRILTFLGPLSPAEGWASHFVQQAAGGVGPGPATARPFRAPHHTASQKALLSAKGRPGEAALASHGLLFLDAVECFPERHVKLLEAVCRVGYVVEGEGPGMERLPASGWVVGARHHCYCGGWGADPEDPTGSCACSDQALNAFGRATDANDPHFHLCLHITPTRESRR